MTKRRPKNNPKQSQTATPIASLGQAASTTRSGDDTTSPPRTLASTKAMLERLPSLSRILSVLMLLLGIFAVGALFYKVMAGFFVPLFLAALLVVIFRPVHDWIYVKTKGKRRLAAASTTLMILMMVLMPMIVVLSVATSQFTAMVSHMNFNDLTAALDRARDQFGISLPHAEKFRRLDELTDSLDDSVLSSEGLRGVNPDTSVSVFLKTLSGVMQAPENRQEILDNIAEAKSLRDLLRQTLRRRPRSIASTNWRDLCRRTVTPRILAAGKRGSKNWAAKKRAAMKWAAGHRSHRQRRARPNCQPPPPRMPSNWTTARLTATHPTLRSRWINSTQKNNFIARV